MSNKLNQVIQLIKEDLGLFLSISLGIFLFVLFFQPFPIDKFDFNNRLLFVAGLGAIVFLFMILVHVTYPWIINNYTKNNNVHLLQSYIGGFSIVVLTSVAFAFYLHYVGSIVITFYIMFKVVLICFASPVLIRLNDVIKELKQKNEFLIKEKKIIQNQIEKYEENYLTKSIEFISENGAENLTLQVTDVAFIKSADNYVEIIYKENETFKRKLLRNTLKNIEQQIKAYSNFIRCHRICIVNAHYIEKLNKNISNHWLIIKGYNEPLPVSRQYLLKLKELF